MSAYDLRNVSGRLAAAEALAGRIRELGACVNVENWDGEPDVDFSLPFLRGNIWLAWTPAAPMPIISWIAAAGLKLRASLPGAWYGNRPHHKATSEPADWPALFVALEIGLLAGIDGSAIERDET